MKITNRLYNDSPYLAICFNEECSLIVCSDHAGYLITMLLNEVFVLEMKGVAKRAAFVIDGSGIVRYAEVLDSAGDLPNFDKIKSTLDNLG